MPVPVEEPEPSEPNGGDRPVAKMGSAKKTKAILHSVHGKALASLSTIKDQIIPKLMDRIDMEAAAELPRENLWHEIQPIISEILGELRLNLNKVEQTEVEDMVLDEMLGLGPLERLLNDDSVTDILVNGCSQVYVERKGKLQLTDVTFRNDDHVMNIAQRIVAKMGRRVDQTQPLVDARLEDGSRVNIIVPPLAIRGPSISIRKFSKKPITVDAMIHQGNMSDAMGRVLKIAAASRLNIVISGGTGSGKTTLLNALSQLIDHSERIVTIEDAAELQLQQPHVVPLETRPMNLEGEGEITFRDLVKNALRMRPDRIILGEIRGAEAIDMLQAMNTGHDGSMCTLHANRPRETLTRLENMVSMANLNLPPEAVRRQIADALDLIVQVERMRDGKRRVVCITEVCGMSDNVITLQDLHQYEYEGEDSDGMLQGSFKSSGLRPQFISKAEYFGLDKQLMETV